MQFFGVGSSIVLTALLVVPAVGALLGDRIVPAQSAFRDKPVLSYASAVAANHMPTIPLRWGDAPIHDFGRSSQIFDEAGVRPLRTAPAPGVHPRIFFTPSDLPDLRRRLRSSAEGRAAYNKILSWTRGLQGRYDEHASYAQPDMLQGRFRGSHGNTDMFYYHDATSPFHPGGDTYQRLIDGDQSIDPAPLWPVFAMEAFRCLIENDVAEGARLGRAVFTAMRHDQAARVAQRLAAGIITPLERPVGGGAGGADLGLVYDLAYPFLAPDIRRAIHDELAAGTWYHDNYGTFNAAIATRSNWATFSYWLVPALAIEGEVGYNELKVAGIYRGWRNFLAYGYYPSGASFEGEAKDQLGMDGVIMLARRFSPNLAGSPHLQAYADRFLPASIIPDPSYQPADGAPLEGPFIKYDLLGGVGSLFFPDLAGLKYLFPYDRIIDFVYRSGLGPHLQGLPGGHNPYYSNSVLFAAMFPAQPDTSPTTGEKLHLPLTYFAGERALLMTRSDWSRDAMMLNMHTRQYNGGHAYADRNSLFIFGGGRIWSGISSRIGLNTQQSLVNIDGKLQSPNSPGRMVDFVDRPLATFAVGDASYAWDWNLKKLSGNGHIPTGWEPERHTANNFSYTHVAGYDYPLFESPSWIAPRGVIMPVVRQVNYPVRMAFRTAGLVRGAHPYGLVLDDIQKDATVHRYLWTMLLEKDLFIKSRRQSADGTIDLTLAGTAAHPGKREPYLLLRVLECRTAGSSATPDIAINESLDAHKANKILTIAVDAIAPAWKVLIFPYREGDAIPDTRWSSDHRTVKINFGAYSDIVRFAVATSGKTDLSIQRSHLGRVIAVDRPIHALPQ